MKIHSTLLYLTLLLFISCGKTSKVEYKAITQTEINDKIKGAWAGKMIGVMHGIGMEFHAVGETFIDSIPWAPQMIEGALGEDDIYGQLSFIETMERNEGLKTPVAKLAEEFALAQFGLAHANLQARKNFLDGIMPPLSGAPEYNMHANDIDFQIESDFIGFMNPGLPYSAALLADSIGRIMAYGDGLYGGIFVSGMHALAFFESDAKIVVKKALQLIPAESEYAKAIQTVIDGYNTNPDNWEKTWMTIQERWGEADLCVPYHPFNIDATINGAYIVMGLLYGENDMGKTIEIAIRCGQDTDCNAANAAAVLGIMYGFEAIDENFKSHIPQMEDKMFIHTNYSFNKAVSQTQIFAEENILSNGGTFEDGTFKVKLQKTKAIGELEQAFPNKIMTELVTMLDKDKYSLTGDWEDFRNGDGDEELYQVSTKPGDVFEIKFNGTGISMMGSYNVDGGTAMAYIDEKPLREFNCYHHKEAGKWLANRQHIIHAMDLEEGDHTLKIVVLDKKEPNSKGHKIYVERGVIFNDK
jgi:hypothetical protein